MRTSFSGYHPVVNLIWFAEVLVFSMCFLSPICLAISLVSSICFAAVLKGRKVFSFGIRFMFPVFLITAVVNPAFNHRGSTVLFYLPSGNPMTYESILFGLAAAAMLVSVLAWFCCWNEVMTSDKFIYLFGRIIPSMSLVLSMTLRFIPRFTKQMRAVSDARKCLGRNRKKTGWIKKIREAFTVLSAVTTWALENSIETSDSMRSRGYGLAGRTAFSVYRFGRRDLSMLLWISFCGVCIAVGWVCGCASYSYYPTLSFAALSAKTVLFAFMYLSLSITPVITEIREEIRWKRLKSAI